MNAHLDSLTPPNAIWPHPNSFATLETRPDRTRQGLELLGDPGNAKGQVYAHSQYALMSMSGNPVIIIRQA